MKYFKCENCGSDLKKNADNNTYSCSYCKRTYYDDSLEKAYDRVYQNLRGTVQGIVSEELLKQKIEQIATCRQALYKERNEQFVDNTEIERWAGEILKLSPKDAQANFYFLASKKRWGELNKFMQKLNAREVPYLVEGFVDYLTNGQFIEKCVLCLSDLIDRSFEVGSKEYAACHKKIVEADKRERSGVFDVSLPRDVFVAYSSKDKEQAYELVEYLERSGFKCFIAMRNLAKGVDAALKYNERLKTAMDSCRVFLLVSSSNSRARDCDAYRIEMQYIRDCDCKKASDSALASARYEEYLEKNRKRCKPRVEYLIEEYGSSPYEKVVKKFFGGLTWCTSLESVSDAVFEIIEGGELEDSEEEKFARERAALEEKLAEEKKAREKLLAELEKKQEDEFKRQLAELEKQKAEADRQKAEMERQKAELAKKEQEFSQRQTTSAPTGNIDDLYKAFKQREREEEAERKRKAEEAERKRQAEEAERNRQEELDRQRKKEEEQKRLEEVRKQLEAQEKIRREQEKIKHDFQIENGVLVKYNGSDEEVVIPKNVKSIGDSAFMGCKSLKNIIIPNGVTSIGRNVFFDCGNLTGVTIPDGIASIGERAFWACCSLTRVTIPASVNYIGKYAFGYCGASFIVSENNKNYKSVNGNLYNKDCTTLIRYGPNKVSKDAYILKSVTAIDDCAFYARDSLTSVTMHEGVTRIGEYAFWGCGSLTSITIPNSVTSIEKGAFSACAGLTSITIPNGVTTIGGQAFESCSGLTDVVIGDSVEMICDNAFRYCRGLKSVTIGANVKRIGASAFEECLGLTSVFIPDSVETIDKDAFRNCASLKKIEVNRRTNITGSGIDEKIVSYRESEEDRIKRLFEIENGVLIKYKGNDSDVVIPNSVTCIGESAFSNCSSLKSVTIPDSVISIGKSAFWGCKNFLKIVIPESVTLIGRSAFSRCSGLMNVVIPNSISVIDERVFYECSNLMSVAIPNSITSIGASAFAYCSSLTSVTIPDSVTSIGDGAFQNCASLTSVTIPNSVTSIGSAAFANCSRLLSALIPNSVTKIGMNTFIGCKKLSIYAQAKHAHKDWYSVSFGDMKGSWNPEKCPVKWGETTAGFDQEAEQKRQNYAITISGYFGKIKKYAFRDRKDMESAIISSDVTEIERWAFENCSNLKKIYIPKSVTTIDLGAFYGCKNLKIFVEAKIKPKDWHSVLFGYNKGSWNSENRPVKWGATIEDFNKA
ncbi:MAG: leucine-rich repeat protein [Clostridia bacterium]|nr:leucine-rich repeat protein [Clostridia bacterium]